MVEDGSFVSLFFDSAGMAYIIMLRLVLASVWLSRDSSTYYCCASCRNKHAVNS